MKNLKLTGTVEQLIEEGRATIETNLAGDDFKKCMNLVKMLTGEQEARTGKHCSDFDANEPDRGLFRRDSKKTNGQKDTKWCFHYRTTIFSEIERKWKEEINELDLFYQLCLQSHKIHSSIAANALRIIKELDKKLPKYKIWEQCSNPWVQDQNVSRAIAYDKPEENQNVANYHFDRNFLTTGAYESHPGLNLIIDGKKTPYVHEEGKLLLFFGEKAELLTNGELEATTHGVDVLEKDIQRDAFVHFTHSLRPYMTRAKKFQM